MAIAAEDLGSSKGVLLGLLSAQREPLSLQAGNGCFVGEFGPVVALIDPPEFDEPDGHGA